MRVQWPHGIVGGSAPPWQTEAERMDRIRSVVNLLLPALSLIVLIGGVLAVFMLWYTRGRDQSVPLTADYLSEPPSDLPAGVVGTLLDERADLKDVMATLLDLAQKGALRIEETEPAKSGLFSSQTRRVHLRAPRRVQSDHQGGADPDQEGLWQNDAARSRGSQGKVLQGTA